ncbi:MAG: ABC transporter ATP-binding protein [Candidatus Korarchaeota archaeon]|nr:ABC transporter ATP-binding protein [Candidatus Korarchaeota archaeon]
MSLSSGSSEHVLAAEGLKVVYETSFGVVDAASDVTFQVKRGEFFGLAGESGCGKSTVAYSLVKEVPPPGRIVGGKIYINGRDVVPLSEDEMRKIRWKEISVIPQAAMNALNPVYTVGDQIAEAILAHEEMSKDDALARAEELLDLVGVGRQRVRSYPHELSGGQRQRVMIAMALALNPPVVIADEPTTALDVVVQAQILNLFKELRSKFNMSLIFITHDLTTMFELVDRIAVMYAGKIVEIGPTDKIVDDPLHPYTELLVRAVPRIGVGEKGRFEYIPGSPPNLLEPPPGCRFHPRCPKRFEPCDKEEPRMVEVEKGRFVACHLIAGRTS